MFKFLTAVRKISSERMFLDLRRRNGKSYTKYLEEIIAAIRASIEESNRFKS
ncbi:hypothetical protein LPB86_17055 [Pedobacter sp. MC2016-14]|uniref:hypothetical protein n=1 Tax=Pedobacter sp. MC2016-14 TaxID=2897327 RepID=UPI001E28328E|nr:hypothetical protein [Pedobacter sp. MC2016-14]MCD0489954.1 hypothetical protein [Pedobacter sp. MC2016-14]